MLQHESQVAQEYQAHFICGCDEAGRGCLAGPVVAAAVYIPAEHYEKLAEVNDSKQLSEKKRLVYFDLIIKYAQVGIAIIEAAEIDVINIYEASRKAMLLAVENLQALNGNIDYILTDAMPLPQATLKHTAIIKGDQQSLSIAAASIIAKCTRDSIMYRYAEKFPQYAFDAHKGYGTKKHLLALEDFGIIEGVHRKSYKPVQKIITLQNKLF